MKRGLVVFQHADGLPRIGDDLERETIRREVVTAPPVNCEPTHECLKGRRRLRRRQKLTGRWALAAAARSTWPNPWPRSSAENKGATKFLESTGCIAATLQLVCLPTTAGTGAENLAQRRFCSTKRQVKKGRRKSASGSRRRVRWNPLLTFPSHRHHRRNRPRCADALHRSLREQIRASHGGHLRAARHPVDFRKILFRRPQWQ